MSRVLCVDFGSTFTKAVLVETDDGSLVATVAHPTTVVTDVLEGYRAIRESLAAERVDDVLACSSAGGGLRLAVVGYERQVTAEAGHRVGLSAGAKVVHVSAGPLDSSGVKGLRDAKPDVVLLVGGTDGGNSDVLVHNARRLGIARLPVPFVLAGNAVAADEAAHELRSRGRRVTIAANVLPRIGVLEPTGARAAIREVFIRHVIGGKGLSRGRTFASMVRAATPDAVLAGVEVLADGAGGVAGLGDVVVVDVGGATTDVYSVITPEGEDATLRKDVVATLWRARTVEGDLGMRWNAPGVVEAARAEGLLDDGVGVSRVRPGGSTVDVDRLTTYASSVAADPSSLPVDAEQHALDVTLARLAVTVAVRRHGRPAAPGGSPRPLAEVQLVIGSGGVLRHHDDGARARALAPAVTDHGGGWRVPSSARLAVDDRYVLFAAGLLAEHEPHAAALLATSALHAVR
ncbi:MAG TPA: glutamate mutase L [Actinomycetales bacterium]|nr:glutamate mutase L [Actinomycetales bacterium]